MGFEVGGIFGLIILVANSLLNPQLSFFSAFIVSLIIEVCCGRLAELSDGACPCTSARAVRSKGNQCE
jgi:hypothetical protein